MLKKIFIFIAAIAIPQIVGLIGAIFTTPQINAWYSTITKPSFNPPNWIFAPVWTVLFFMMGLSLYLILTKPSSKVKSLGLTFFFMQLVFNLLWSFLFFSIQNPFYAFIEIILLWIVILMTIYYFAKVEKTAAYLLIPYIAWVSFAAVLNYSIWKMN